MMCLLVGLSYYWRESLANARSKKRCVYVALVMARGSLRKKPMDFAFGFDGSYELAIRWHHRLGLHGTDVRGV